MWVIINNFISLPSPHYLILRHPNKKGKVVYIVLKVFNGKFLTRGDKSFRLATKVNVKD
jgi:hypothetical protein